MPKKAKAAFTAKSVEAIKPDPSKRLEIPDGGLTGLYLIVQPSGVKSWAIRYGKMPKITIGSYPATTLAMAREEAQPLLRAIAEGRNPAAEKKAAKAVEASGVNLVENVLDNFVKRHVKKKNRDSTAGDVEGYIRREIKPLWKGKQIQSIKRRDIVELLDALVDRGVPTRANRVHALLRKFFNWTLERGILEANPFGSIKAPSPENSRDRVLSDSEIRLMWLAADEIGWPFGPMVKMLLLTAARREEVAAAPWAEFSVDGKEPTWLIPRERAKNRKEQSVPLSPAAVAILAALPRIVGKAGLVFTTTGETSISGFSRGKARLDRAMLAIARKEAEERGDDPDAVSIPTWVVHDLRRTAASTMARLGVPPHVVEAILGHKSDVIKGVAAIYNRHDYDAEKRAALIRWAAHVEALIAEKPGAAIIPLRRMKEKLSSA
jgi:integrase